MKPLKVYRSSAGSGKTFTLAKEYLKLALVTPGNLPSQKYEARYFRHILAVTFTNDAANEMKFRIIGQLTHILSSENPNQSVLWQMIRKEIAEEYPNIGLTDEQLLDRTRQLLGALLHNYSDFAVSTLDSFNNRIVQAFKKELNLPFHFEIALNPDEWLEKAVAHLQEKIGNPDFKEISQILTDFAIYKIEDEKDWSIDKALFSFGKILFQENSRHFVKAITQISPQQFQKTRHKVQEYLQNLEKQLKELAQKALDIINQAGLNHDDFSRKQIPSYFRELLEKDLLNSFKLDKSKQLAEQLNGEGEWYTKKLALGKKAQIDSIKPAIMAISQQIDSIIAAESTRFIIANQLNKEFYLLATLSELAIELEKVKAENNIVLLSEYNQRINEVVENEPVPFIYEQLGDKYYHILIDEFQDTSQLQWHNLMPLVGNALAQNLLCLIVGDAKQSIYQWRGAKAQMLVDLPHIPDIAPDSPLSDSAFLFEETYEGLVLNKNFRSRDNIVTFNNLFFTSLENTEDELLNDKIKTFYADTKQEINGKEGGQVQITVFPKEEDESENIFWATLHHIRQCLADGYQYGDIALLVRSNSDGAFLAQRLTENKIEVVTTEALTITRSAAVNMLIHLFKMTEDETQLISRFNFLAEWQRLTYSTQPELSAILQNILTEFRLIHPIEKSLPLSDFWAIVAQKTQYAIHYPDFLLKGIYSLTEAVIRTFKLNLYPAEQPFLEKFIDMIEAFAAQKSNSIRDFLQYWELNGHETSIKTADNPMAVKVMTIHKSKGLEYPIVMIPFASWKTSSSGTKYVFADVENEFIPQLSTMMLTANTVLKKSAVFEDTYSADKHSTHLEALNMLYVACTRPTDRLYLCLPPATKNDSYATVAGYLHIFLKKIEADITPQLTTFKTNERCFDAQTYVLFQDDASYQHPKQSTLTTAPELVPFPYTNSYPHISLKVNTFRKEENTIELQKLYQAIEYGKMAHYAFEKVQYKNDVNKAVRSLLYEGVIRPEDEKSLAEHINKIVNLEVLVEWFTPRPNRIVRNEQEILMHTTELHHPVVLRPDRLVFDGKKVVIIDYKTGEYQEKYKKQVLEYAVALQTAGYHPTNCMLVYTETATVVQVQI